MIRYTPASELSLQLFRTPFEQALDPANRWVRMAEVVPWDELASIFIRRMSLDQGRVSIDLRHVLGALLVKHIEELSDEDTIVYIQENIYAQYFVGLRSFQTAPIFVPTLFVEIRKRLGRKGAQELNDKLLGQAQALRAIKHRRKAQPSQQEPPEPPADTPPPPVNEAASPAQDIISPEAKPLECRGTLKVDATVAPQHIAYPTDTGLLNEARRQTEALIDALYVGSAGFWACKPRTYRRKAREQYLGFSKGRRPTKQRIRRAMKQQLGYVRRNLSHLNRMLDELAAAGRVVPWTHAEWRRLWIVQEVYRQQAEMYRDGRRRIADRIVSLHQPHVRPIVRGKAGRDVEFGAKLNVSETEGFMSLDQVSFDNFNESTYLEQQVEAYRRRFGYYPEVVLADRIYLTRENRNYLASKGIRHSGPPLGRPAPMRKNEKERRRREQNKRSQIEGKFGQAKLKYGLDNILMKRPDTSIAAIGLIMLALNVVQLQRAFLLSFLVVLTRGWSGLGHAWTKFKSTGPVHPLLAVRPAPQLAVVRVTGLETF